MSRRRFARTTADSTDAVLRSVTPSLRRALNPPTTQTVDPFSAPSAPVSHCDTAALPALVPPAFGVLLGCKMPVFPSSSLSWLV